MMFTLATSQECYWKKHCPEPFQRGRSKPLSLVISGFSNFITFSPPCLLPTLLQVFGTLWATTTHSSTTLAASTWIILFSKMLKCLKQTNKQINPKKVCVLRKIENRLEYSGRFYSSTWNVSKLNNYSTLKMLKLPKVGR